MENKHVIDKRVVKLAHVLSEDYIPFLGGRPDREKVISNDDVTNVSILLNTAKSVEELLSNM